MPYKNINELPASTKNLSDKQKEVFLEVFNKLVYDGVAEDSAFPQAMAAAEKVKDKMKKSVNIEIDAEEYASEGKSGFLHDFIFLLERWFGGSNKEHEYEVEITKAVDEEQRRALFVVLEPDVVDLHGDTYSADEVEKACISFNTHSMKANLFHRVETQDTIIEQSFISPSAFVLDDGREIKKGTWLQWWHFPENNEVSDKLWQMTKAKEITGVSIGAYAKAEDLE